MGNVGIIRKWICPTIGNAPTWPFSVKWGAGRMMIDCGIFGLPDFQSTQHGWWLLSKRSMFWWSCGDGVSNIYCFLEDWAKKSWLEVLGFLLGRCRTVRCNRTCCKWMWLKQHEKNEKSSNIKGSQKTKSNQDLDFPYDNIQYMLKFASICFH